MKRTLYVKIREAFVSILTVVGAVAILALTPTVSFTNMEMIVFLVSSVFLILGIGLFTIVQTSLIMIRWFMKINVSILIYME